MPSNGKFGFSILVGNKELPEYTHPEDSTRVLVESILWAPVTYQLEIKEFCKFSGEIEAQKWPVTPYEIKVRCDMGSESLNRWPSLIRNGIETSRYHHCTSY